MVTMDMLDPRQQLTMGQDSARFRSRLENPPVARAYGDGASPDLAISPDTRQAAPAMPGHGGLSFTRGGQRGLGGASSFAGLRYPEQQQPSPFPDGIGGSGSAYGGGVADGVLTVRDRHIMTRHGHTRHSTRENDSALPNPQHDGPPMAEYQMVNTTESWQLGTDNTANQDNTGVHNTVEVLGGGGQLFPLGQQDGTETPVFGPPIGEWREYGVRGGAGMHGPDPDIIDPNWIPRNPATGTAGSGGRGRLVAAGAPGMQSYDLRTVYGGVPHGLHSPTAPSVLWTRTRQASIPQMTAPRLDRPASSKVAGQSESQGFPPESAFGASAAKPRMQDPGRRPGLGARFLGRS